MTLHPAPAVGHRNLKILTAAGLGARQHARPMDFAGRPMPDFVSVRAEALKGRALRGWVEAAIAAAESRPPSEAEVGSR